MIRVHKRDRDEGGQTLIFFVLAMPLFLAIIALVIDGSMLLVKKRSLQNAADAAALAAAQDWPLGGPCVGACLASLQTSANNYSDKNGGPALHPCNDPDPANPKDTNCFAAPYVDKSGTAHDGQVEVRLTVSTPTLFTKAVGLKGLFDVSARAVAGSNPILGQSTVPGTTVDGSTIFNTIPGGVHTTTDPGQVSGGSGIGFAMSRSCSAIIYGGNPKGQVTGAFATNGGLTFQGSGSSVAKKVFWLAYNASGPNQCPKPGTAASGTSNCAAKAWGDPNDLPQPADNCVKTLVDLNQNGSAPINWPLPPPTPPTPTALAGTNPYPTDWYPSKCIDLGNGPFVDHGPGIYCVRGAGVTLNLNNLNQGSGDGYTFYALDGAKISVGSNGSTLKFYWPSACGAGTRPTNRASSYACPGLNQTITDYDPFTLLYATFASGDGTCAICLSGGNNNLTGDIFAPNPNSFPPSIGQKGGLVEISGGGLAAGSGFIESWSLSITGNTGSYSGTGTSIVVPGGTHTTTDSSTVQTIIQTGTTNSGTILVTTIGTDIGLGQ